MPVLTGVGGGCSTPYSAQDTPRKDLPLNVHAKDDSQSTLEIYGVRLWAQKDGSMWGGVQRGQAGVVRALEDIQM